MENNIAILSSQINEKRNFIEYKMPFPEDAFDPLRENLIYEWICNSNALEGNTLDINETKTILNGVTVGGKTINEHLEVLNHQEAISYLETITDEDTELSEGIIKNIHELLYKNIDPLNAGIYRRENINIRGLKVKISDYVSVQSDMESFIDWYHSSAELNFVEKSAYLLAKFISISPFLMGNIKVGILLLNLELIKTGLVPIVIRNEKKSEYFEALENALRDDDYSKLKEYIANEINEQLDSYVEVLL